MCVHKVCAWLWKADACHEGHQPMHTESLLLPGVNCVDSDLKHREEPGTEPGHFLSCAGITLHEPHFPWMTSYQRKGWEGLC